jgi:branched-chain amino acid aminotransferase
MNVCFNGSFYPAEAPLLTAQNRSFKWGDGVFETMKVFRGKILLANLHFERLFISLRLLQIQKSETISQAVVEENILSLCSQNNCLSNARVRLAAYRTDENSAGYLIEAIPLDEEVNNWQEDGLTLTLYPYARKSQDAFASLKSANYLLYILAGRYAIEKGADDALVLNADNFLCDSSKANIFLLTGNKLRTPALHQGCINGVVRRVIIEEAGKHGLQINQEVISEEELLAADEVFLTNAIQVIRWVKQYKHKNYQCASTRKIYAAIAAIIFT